MLYPYLPPPLKGFHAVFTQHEAVYTACNYFRPVWAEKFVGAWRGKNFCRSRKRASPMKKKAEPPKGKEEEGGGLLVPILYAALGGIGGFLVILFIGVGIGAFDAQGKTAGQPSAQPSYRGTLPTQRPTQEPVQTLGLEQTDSPAETELYSQTQAPSNPPVDPTDATQAPTALPTQAPEQSGSAGTVRNNDGTYTHDFSGGRMLGTVNSDKYHYYDCRAAKTIPPENCVWYNSEDEAKADGRSRCGICWR